MHTLDLGYDSVPLSMNSRMHWGKSSRITKQIRTTAWLLARQAKVPTNCDHVTVCLHYRPKVNRRRDSDNLMPVLKAACDGLVDAGLVADDTPDQMTKQMPVIHPAEKGRDGALWLTITIGDPQ
ncbi:hypothetical protein [Rhodococcus sp. LW-XY12]|uniref:hypothetical protein n=1 Tax=Rhodococcus sp. LW-XY12 TaxID=2856851 RepID=UPI001C599D79|nr:hypothetical protein [Rhodococcus sp. LW-XY12]QXU56284.1 hypothetical protein KXC42_23410 [Rhodococcus sp. LW-XY12]